MTELDKLIRETLAEEDAKLLDEVGGELSLLQKGLELFRTNSAWFITMVVGVQLSFMAVMIYAAVSFFQSNETKDLIMFGCIFLFANLVVAILKIWSWMEINRNALTREIKRLELQVAYMSRRLFAGENGE